MVKNYLFAGNWKMHHTQQETLQFFMRFLALTQDGTLLEKSNAPSVQFFCPYLDLEKAIQAVRETSIQIGAQNAHWEDQGAFTGEVSVPMLQEIGVFNCLIGHSERRQFFGETENLAHSRAFKLLNQGLNVVYCIGEDLKQRESGETEAVLKTQLEGAIQPNDESRSLTSHIGGGLVLAYEPIWAIGTGQKASFEQIQQAHQVIRQWVEETISPEKAQKLQILYGGSVKPDNIEELLSIEDLDGFLVGGASLDPETFWSMIQSAMETTTE